METIESLDIAKRMVESVLSWYQICHMRWHYEDALVFKAILDLAEISKDSSLEQKVRTYYDALVQPDGSILTYRRSDYNLDQINAGKNLFKLHALFKEEKYRLAIELLMEQLREQPRTKSGGFWHKRIYPWQIWLDGLYMAVPFYAQYIKEYGPPSHYDDIVRQLVEAGNKTQDEATGLLYHAWDESRQQLWADPRTGCSPHFWGRAMGWYCMALVDVLDYLPATHPGKPDLIARIRTCVRALLDFQDASSDLWFQILDQGGRNENYLESSASAMFVYFLHKTFRMGYDSSEKLKECAWKGYRALVRDHVVQDTQGYVHLEGICSVAGLGGSPYRDGSYQYYVHEPVVQDDFKGIGAFILASVELSR